jgi:hypothetical protein
MSDECEITGFTPQQQGRWPLVHQHLCDQLELPNGEAISAEAIEKLSHDLENTLKVQSANQSALKKRNGLFEHLKRSIESKFKGSSLRRFGSSESGLSLAHGDLDLCLLFEGQKPKKILRSISSMLRFQEMEDILVITSAKVPIIKFVDERTKIPVDISINNTLALHNTTLLKRYAETDERIRQCILGIKYWASQRDVCDAAKGTFSSYAWTLIMLQALQTTTPSVAPNIQSGKTRTHLKVEGIEYDLTMADEPQQLLTETNTQSLGELMTHCFRQLVLERPWEQHVLSIRNGKPLTRKEKKWNYAKPHAEKAVVMDGKNRLGLHSFPVEDPFNHDHDLSRVLRPDGALDIQEELFRFWIGLNEGKTLNQLCELKNPERIQVIVEKDLFEDLRKLPKSEVDTMLKENAVKHSDLEERIEALNGERQNNIKISQALRGLFEETSGLRNEHRTLVRSLRPRSQKMDLLQKERDELNQKIGIPLYRIRELLVEVYTNLTGDIDFFHVPSLQREDEQFAWFFELQAMHAVALKADTAHKEFIVLVREQKKAVKELKITETKQTKIRTELIESEPILANITTEFSEARQFDQNAHSLNKVIQGRRKELRHLRREKGRLEAWLRVSTRSTPTRDSKPRGKKKDRGSKSGQADWAPRNNGPRAEEVQQRAATGGTLSLSDLDVLLNSGGLASVNKSKPTPKTARRADRKKKQNSVRQLTAQRGERSQSKKGHKE